MVKKVITNLRSSTASGPDCFPVAVLKNCEPELVSQRVLFSRLLEGLIDDPHLRMLGKGLLSVVSKVFEKLVNNRIVDHLEKCGIFSNF